MTLRYIRQATKADLPAMLTIIADAKTLLKADGSPQWQDGSPSQAQLLADIEKQQSYVLILGDKIVGTAALVTEPDPHYAEIEAGAWRSTLPYATIHRIAVASNYRGQQLAHYFCSNLISRAYSLGFRALRIDTHQQNLRMQKLITALDFHYCGIIYVAPTPHGRRLAYELILGAED